jgi:hypothetical protein
MSVKVRVRSWSAAVLGSDGKMAWADGEAPLLTCCELQGLICSEALPCFLAPDAMRTSESLTVRGNAVHLPCKQRCRWLTTQAARCGMSVRHDYTVECAHACGALQARTNGQLRTVMCQLWQDLCQVVSHLP